MTTKSSPSFTPEGREIIVPNFRASNVSIVDFDPPRLARAVLNLPLTRPDGAAARPKGFGGHRPTAATP